MELLRDLKNRIDFYLRDKLRVSLKIPKSDINHSNAIAIQSEFEEFLRLVNWGKFFNPGSRLRIADVGTRTFAFGPVFERVFKKQHFEMVDVHGFEIDAYRRFTNFRSRADYGRYYASQMENGFYHPMDFLKCNLKFDIIFLLNPFVTKEPLLNWGLPLKAFQPQKLFAHCLGSLKKNGLLILSAPNQEELGESLKILTGLGFKSEETFNWQPSNVTAQKQPRFGVALKNSASR